LENETFELESVKADLKDSKANIEIATMNSSLSLMSGKAEELAASINNAITQEQNFFNEPDTNKLNAFRDNFDEAFSLSKELNESVISYNASVTRLKTIISSASLDASKKNQLLSFADAPSQLMQVSSKAIVADSVKQAVDSAFNSSLSRSKDLVDNLVLRIKRNSAAKALKSYDTDFRSKTGNRFDSLEQAATAILSDDYYSLWKNQQKLSEFSENYSRAKSLFDKGDFDLSLTYSQKAKSNAVVILTDGLIEQDTNTIDWSLWIYFAVAIIALFAFIFVLRNRGKFSLLVQPQNSGEEVKLHEWEKSV
jgi:hypothetical protein